jgi:hypothetical protein
MYVQPSYGLIVVALPNIRQYLRPGRGIVAGEYDYLGCHRRLGYRDTPGARS